MSSSLFPSMDNKISSGVHELDLILEGGYPNPGVVLLLGQPCDEKLAIGFEFMAALNKQKNEDEAAIYFTCEMTPDRTKKKADELGISLPFSDIKYIDAYSLSVGLVVHEPNVTAVDSPGALNDISLALRTILDETKSTRKRVLFHSLSPMSLQVQNESLIKFIHVITGRLKQNKCTLLLMVNEGMHDKAFLSALESMSDMRMKVDSEEGTTYLHISGVSVPIPIRAKGAGLEIL